MDGGTNDSEATAAKGIGEFVRLILRRVADNQSAVLLGALLLLLAVIRMQNPLVFMPRNLIDIGLAVSIIGILALAQMVVIVSGGLDISVGSIAGLAAVTTALVLSAGGTGLMALFMALAVGTLAGLVNALLVTLFRINPIIATLATFSAYSGVALVISNGRAIPAPHPGFRYVGVERVLGLPIPLLLFLGIAVLVHCFMAYTVIGRRVYALGSNSIAARNTGINLVRYRLALYSFSGLAGGIAGTLLVARTRLGTAAGTGMLGLTAITAALLGGAALNGGRGRVSGVLLGVALLGVLDNGLVLTRTPPFYADVAVGILLIVAVALQQVRRPRSEDVTA